VRSALLCGVVALAACGGGTTPELPDLTGAEVLVARALREAAADLRRAPESAERWGRYGELCDVHGYPAEAAAAYAHAAGLAPAEWRWPYLAGTVLRPSDAAAAAAHFEAAGRLRQDYAPLCFYLGLARLQADDASGAEPWFARAKALDATLLNARLGLARVALARGDAQAALDELAAAETLAPDDAARLSHVAQALRLRGQAGDLEAAAEAEQRAAASSEPQRSGGLASMSDPVRDEIGLRVGTSMLWRARRSAAQLAAGRGEAALTEWEALLAVEPDATVALVESARVLAGLGRRDEARRRLERAVGLVPGDGQVLAELGTLLEAAGESAAALDALQRAHELAPQDGNILNNLAGMLFARGDVERGLELMRQACDAMPQSADVHYNLGAALDRVGRGSEALPALRRALLVDRRHARARSLLATLHARAGNYAEAAVHFRRVVEDHPDDLAARRDLGRALWWQGEHREAIAVYREALARAPGEPSVAIELAWALATSATERAPAEALALAQQLVDASGHRDPRALDTLGAAQAAGGDFAAARASVDEALAILATVRDAARAAQDGAQAAQAEGLIGQLALRRSQYAAGVAHTERPP
jgi:tetratricopeptide (TPR) repeat protein